MQQLFSDRKEQDAPRRGKSSGHGKHFMFHDAKCTSLDVKRTSLDVKYTFHAVKHQIPGASVTFSRGKRNFFHRQPKLFPRVAGTILEGKRNSFRGHLQPVSRQPGTFPRNEKVQNNLELRRLLRTFASQNSGNDKKQGYLWI